MIRDAMGRDSVAAAPLVSVSAVEHPDTPHSAGDVTQILMQAACGSAHAAEALLPLVYDELRRLAARKLSAEKPGLTLQATALVHEAYVRLVGDDAQQWDSRNHFFVAAAEAMRRILVENARQKASIRRGGEFRRHDLELESLPLPEASEEVLAVNDALQQLASERPTVAKLVELRYFGGLTLEEAAALLEVSPRTAHRYWAYARAWLHHELVCGTAGTSAGPKDRNFPVCPWGPVAGIATKFRM
jgi:RNA polymerase sigma factor (TIGR02999 family)